MIDPTGLRALATYNQWFNERLYDAAERLPEAARAEDRGAFFRSIHGTLSHILLADRLWLRRLTAAPQRVDPPSPTAHGAPESASERYASRDAHGAPIPITGLDTVLYPAWTDLRRERRRTDDDLLAWVSGLSTEALAADVTYLRGDAPQSHPLWWAALHLFHHQTHHRGQVTTLLSQAGVDPGVTDLIAWLRMSPP